MSESAWISILIAVATILSGIIAFLIRRRIARIDALELAVFGEAGVTHKLHKYVTHDGLEQRLAVFNDQMRGLRDEGEKREERILSAINNQTLTIGGEVRELKADIRAQNGRIDAIIGFTNNDR